MERSQPSITFRLDYWEVCLLAAFVGGLSWTGYRTLVPSHPVQSAVEIAFFRSATAPTASASGKRSG